jgi:hypothetical protein
LGRLITETFFYILRERASFAGTGRNSEPEVRRATEFILSKRDNIRASLSLHSYGKLTFSGTFFMKI